MQTTRRRSLTAELARKVVIHRDAFGIPHVFGDTDAAAIFGSACAQAEDNFDAIETSYLTVLGRLAEKAGPAALAEDLLARALDLPGWARKEYRRADTHTRTLCDAFAAGLNLHLDRRSIETPAVIQCFEPWHVFALYRILHLWALRSVPFDPREIFGGLGSVRRNTSALHAISGLRGIQTRPPGTAALSSAWALAPQRTTSASTALISCSHVAFGSLYELHVASGEGLNIAGAGYWGMPIPMLGATPCIAWSLTANFPRVADLYAESFTPRGGRAYRHGGKRLRATDWRESLCVKTPRGLQRFNVSFRKTRHGPIVSVRDGAPIAARVAHLVEGGAFQQFLAMSKSRTFRKFKEAIRPRALIFHNILYADLRGNIYYLYNGAIPRRGAKSGLPALLDGADPRTEWQSYHALKELPQTLNPRHGFLQNCNSSPFVTANEGNPDPARFPGYLVRESDNLRAAESRSIAARTRRFTLKEIPSIPFATVVPAARILIPELLREWQALRSSHRKRARPLRPVVKTLERWRYVSSQRSIATTLFVLTSEMLSRMTTRRAPRWPRISALERTVSRLRRRFGTWAVPWGKINRLQRPPRGGRWDDRSPSLSIAGCPTWTGAAFAFDSADPPLMRRRYGYFGNAYVFMAELKGRVQLRSIAPFGQSSDPRSPHFFDQSRLYSRATLKRVALTLADVRRGAVRTYSPELRGGRSRRSTQRAGPQQSKLHASNGIGNGARREQLRREGALHTREPVGRSRN